MRPVVVGDGGSEHHPTPRGLLFTATLQDSSFRRKPVFDVNVSLFENPNAIAGDHHLLGWIDVHLDDNGPINFSLDAGSWIFATHPAGLVKHMRSHPAEVRANKNLQTRRLVVADQTHNRKSIAGAIFHRSARTLGLVSGAVLLLRLAYYLQLRFAIAR